jgi:two-component system, OmpR family, response regulator CpxR
MAKRILIIDDDKELCGLIDELLGADGFVVEAYNTGRGAAERAITSDASLIILDVMLPEVNGFEILRHIRRSSQIPVILLTARGDDVDRIVGLEIGADDYLPKPFNPRELAARIQSVLRRAEPRAAAADSRVLTVGDVVLDPRARTVFRHNAPVELTTVEFDLLQALLGSAGEVIGRDVLTQTVLGRELSPFDRSIDMHVSKVRRKLGDRADGVDRIKTVRGAGYIYTLPSQIR